MSLREREKERERDRERDRERQTDREGETDRCGCCNKLTFTPVPGESGGTSTHVLRAGGGTGVVTCPAIQTGVGVTRSVGALDKGKKEEID